uniref:Uncharacterized protein n=1 Tax=Cacopsylla melanoneura TaxID=428564 RepID=A0A8D8XZ08_9HEMI
MIRTVTQEVALEERLKPEIVEPDHPAQSKYQCCQRNFDKGMHSKLACGLLRSPSLERLRQFPSYLCTRGSYDFKLWLENSRTSLSASISRSLLLAHEFLFTTFVYSIILIICAQMCFVVNTLVFSSVPRGPTFLYVTTSVLGAIMFVALPHMATVRPRRHLPTGQDGATTSSTKVSDKTE